MSAELRAKCIDVTDEGRWAQLLADLQMKIKQLGMTQEEIAERCGWQQPLVSAYLTGAKEPGAKNLAKLAAAVGCSWRLVPNEKTR